MEGPVRVGQLSPGGIAQMVGTAAGTASAVVGALMLWVGAGALLPSTAALALVPAGLVALGGLVVLVAIGLNPHRFRTEARSALPELYPFGAAGVQLGVFVLWLVGTVAIAHGVFDIFTAADTGLAADSAAGQASSDALLTAASAVLWVLALYAVFGMNRVIRMGRQIDAASGRSASGGGAEALAPTAPERSVQAAAPPPPTGSGWAITGVSLVLALGISAGIQTLEVNLGPAPAVSWAWAQLLTPIYVVPFIMAVLAIDRGVRGLEREYVRGLARAPPPSTGAASE